MPSTYTSSLRLVLPATGELSNTWGTVFNAGATSLIDASIAGTASITMTAANYTLSNNNGATDEARAMFLVLGGTPGASYNVICPAVSKLYFVTNNTGFAQTVKTSAGSGVSVPNGARMALRCDGTDVVAALNYFSSLTLGTPLVATSGGTGQSSYAVGDLLYASTTTDLSKLADVATGNALISGGVGVAPAWGKVGLTTHVTGTLPVTNGGTGLATFAALSLPVANTLNTLTALTATAGQSVRVNAGGSAWEAYTPASGSGDVTGPGSSVSGNIVTFNGTTGKIIQDGGKALPSGSVVGTTDSQTLTNKTIEAGTFTNGYTEETVTANTSTAYTIDLANGTVQILTLTGNCTFTFPTATAGKSFILLLKQDGTGSRTVTWPAAVKWPSSVAPTITSTASRLDKYVFTADGTNWYGSVGGLNYTV